MPESTKKKHGDAEGKSGRKDKISFSRYLEPEYIDLIVRISQTLAISKQAAVERAIRYYAKRVLKDSGGKFYEPPKPPEE